MTLTFKVDRKFEQAAGDLTGIVDVLSLLLDRAGITDTDLYDVRANLPLDDESAAHIRRVTCIDLVIEALERRTT
jgi:hypothetical protein